MLPSCALKLKQFFDFPLFDPDLWLLSPFLSQVSAHWSSVVDECRRAHFQPLLLVYTNPHGQAVDASEAPTDVVPTEAAKVQSNNQSPETTPTPSLQPNAKQVDVQEPKSQSGYAESVGTQQGTVESQPVVGPSSVPSNSAAQEQDLITFSLSPVVLANIQTHDSGSAVQDRAPFSSSCQTENRFNNLSAVSTRVTASEPSWSSPGQARWNQSTAATSQMIENRDILEPVLHSTLALAKTSKAVDTPIPSAASNLDQRSGQLNASTFHPKAMSPSSLPKGTGVSHTKGTSPSPTPKGTGASHARASSPSSMPQGTGASHARASSPSPTPKGAGTSHARATSPSSMPQGTGASHARRTSPSPMPKGSSGSHARSSSPSSMPMGTGAESPSLYPNLNLAHATTTGHPSSYTQPPQSNAHGSADPHMPVAPGSHSKELYSNKRYLTGVGAELTRPSTVSKADSTPPTRRSVDESAVCTKTLEEIGQSEGM